MSNLRRINRNKKKERAFKEVGGTDAMQIENLNDDCLLQIFQYLPIADRIRLERVSKRWQALSQKSWNTFKNLDFHLKTWGLERIEGKLNTYIYYKVVQLSGRYLTRINVGIQQFSEVCHFLSNIQELSLYDFCWDEYNMDCKCSYNAWQVIISWLLSHGDKITNFQLQMEHMYHKEEDFAQLLRKMKRLKSFGLHDCQHLTNCSRTFLLELLFDTIEKIILDTDDCHFFKSDLVSLMIRKCKKLQTLCLGDFVDDPADPIFEALPSQALSLKYLKMDLELGPSKLSNLFSLTNLEKLDFQRCDFITDPFLEGLAKHCKKLDYLAISNCDEVTDKGISSLSNLEKLTYLSIDSLSQLINPPLEKFENLLVFGARYNGKIQEKSFCSLLKNAPQLRALDVTGCTLVTNKLLNVAIRITKMRSSNNALTLFVRETGINMKLISKKPPLLNVNKSKDCYYGKFGVKGPLECI